MGLAFVCSWSGSLLVLWPAEPLLVVFSSELVLFLSPPSPGPGPGMEAACYLSLAICRFHVGAWNPQRLIALQIPREMKNVLLRLPAALFVIPIRQSLSLITVTSMNGRPEVVNS